jgi:hypothetical protein
MKAAFNSTNFLNIQTVDTNWITLIYAQLTELLKENAISALQLFQQSSQYIVIGFMIGFVAAIYAFYKTVLIPIESERNDWRKMIRVVPNKVILSNNHLKSYLIHNCEGYLDSVRKMLQ